jgi:hypothetical protein
MKRFWWEAVPAATSGLLAAITLAWHEWLEIVFGVDPDHGNGAVEWLIVVLATTAAVTLGVLARREWLRTTRFP